MLLSCVCVRVCKFVCFVSVCPYVPISIAFNCCIMVVRLHSRLVHLFLAFVSEAAMAASKQVVVYIEHLACIAITSLGCSFYVTMMSLPL